MSFPRQQWPPRARLHADYDTHTPPRARHDCVRIVTVLGDCARDQDTSILDDTEWTLVSRILETGNSRKRTFGIVKVEKDAEFRMKTLIWDRER